MKRLFIFLLLLVTTNIALASTGNTGMPYEDPLQKFYESLTGPTAFYVAGLASFACLAGLVFGGEMQSWVRSILLLIMGVAALVSVNSFIKNFTGRGAVLSEISVRYQTIRSVNQYV